MQLLKVLIALCLGVCSVAAKEKQQEVLNFTPKPDGQTNKVTLTRGKVECTFEYASTGGTDEEWLMTITKDKTKRTYTCLIERPEQKSYLYFMHFKATLSHLATAVIYDNEKPLPSEEIVIEKGPNHVGIVRNADGKFSGALKQLVLETTAAAKKVEL